jgi:hypothetical protein
MALTLVQLSHILRVESFIFEDSDDFKPMGGLQGCPVYLCSWEPMSLSSSHSNKQTGLLHHSLMNLHPGNPDLAPEDLPFRAPTVQAPQVGYWTPCMTKCF